MAEDRFAFGANWRKFLTRVNEERIGDAERSIRNMLEVGSLAGKRFLDVGSGSGLFSLAARRLGANVHSFDYDPQSVACTAELKARFFPDDPFWVVEQGSILDAPYLKRLGKFDVVYSWGVVHHTGAMWEGLDNVLAAVGPSGTALVSIYNAQGWVTRYWTRVKETYVRHPILRWPLVLVHVPYLLGVPLVTRAATGRLKLERGMTYVRDLTDWIGGYPFEAAKPEEVLEFGRARGFSLAKLRTVGGRQGCNEFVFVADEE